MVIETAGMDDDSSKERSSYDPIAESIRQRGSLRKISGESSGLAKANRSISQRVFEVGVSGLPARYYGENPGIAEVGSIIAEVNRVQRGLDRLTRMRESDLYRGWVNCTDYLKSLVGLKGTHTNVHELFIRQQQNIGDLNCVLVSMVQHYEPDLNKTKAALDGIINVNEKEHSERLSLEEGKLRKELAEYETGFAKLNEMSRDDPDYFQVLKQVVGSKRGTRQFGYKRRIAKIGDEHHSKDIENLCWQEELFETTLFRAMEMAYLTDLYQDTLGNNLRVWMAVAKLSDAVQGVSRGIGILSEFNKQLNDSYIHTVQEINQMADTHSGYTQIDNTNANLRRLVQDVHSTILKSEMVYGEPKGSIRDSQ